MKRGFLLSVFVILGILLLVFLFVFQKPGQTPKTSNITTGEDLPTLSVQAFTNTSRSAFQIGIPPTSSERVSIYTLKSKDVVDSLFVIASQFGFTSSPKITKGTPDYYLWEEKDNILSYDTNTRKVSFIRKFSGGLNVSDPKTSLPSIQKTVENFISDRRLVLPPLSLKLISKRFMNTDGFVLAPINSPSNPVVAQYIYSYVLGDSDLFDESGRKLTASFTVDKIGIYSMTFPVSPTVTEDVGIDVITFEELTKYIKENRGYLVSVNGGAQNRGVSNTLNFTSAEIRGASLGYLMPATGSRVLPVYVLTGKADIPDLPDNTVTYLLPAIKE